MVMKGIVDAHHLVVKTRTLASLNLVHVATGVMVGCEGHYCLLCLGGDLPLGSSSTIAFWTRDYWRWGGLFIAFCVVARVNKKFGCVEKNANVDHRV